jgi:flagellar motor switch protein FliN/FliY
MTMHQHAKWLITEWARGLSEVLAAMTGQQPHIDCQPASESQASGDLIKRQAYGLLPYAYTWVAAGARQWTEIGNRALRAAGINDAPHEDLQGTYVEILGQAQVAFAQALSARLLTEITSGEMEDVSAVDPNALVYRVEIGFPAAPSIPITVSLSTALIDAVSDAPAGYPAGASEASRTLTADTTQVRSRTLDLLLEVELPVSVSFGRSELPLKDVVKLSAGSIIELNRSVTEPVEVIVNNCVIARGEVVVVEGNYGVRITEIISRQERLRTLH